MKHDIVTTKTHILKDESGEIIVVVEGNKVLSIDRNGLSIPLWGIPASVYSVVSYYIPGVVIGATPTWVKDGASVLVKFNNAGRTSFYLPATLWIGENGADVIMTDGTVLYQKQEPHRILSGWDFGVLGESFSVSIEECVKEPSKGNYITAINILEKVIAKCLDYEADAYLTRFVSTLLILALKGFNNSI